jgi:hypothetical protein
MTPETILAAILAIFPHMSGHNRRCIVENHARIVQQLHEASQPHEPGAPVPPLELTAAVAFAETHLGCDANEGGNWGAPISRMRRHTAGTHLHAVRVLANSYLVCGRNWDRAVMRFRTGLCYPHASSSPLVRMQGPRYLRTIRAIIHRMHSHDALARGDRPRGG